jgi:hypothetical protein
MDEVAKLACAVGNAAYGSTWRADHDTSFDMGTVRRYCDRRCLYLDRHVKQRGLEADYLVACPTARGATPSLKMRPVLPFYLPQ